MPGPLTGAVKYPNQRDTEFTVFVSEQALFDAYEAIVGSTGLIPIEFTGRDRRELERRFGHTARVSKAFLERILEWIEAGRPSYKLDEIDPKIHGQPRNFGRELGLGGTAAGRVESLAKSLLFSLLQECHELIGALAAKGWTPVGADTVKKQFPDGWVQLWAYEHAGQTYVYGTASRDVQGVRKDGMEYEDTIEKEIDDIAQEGRSAQDFADYLDDEVGGMIPGEDEYHPNEEGPEPEFEGLKTASVEGPNGTITAVLGKPIGFKRDVEQTAIVKDIRIGGWNGRVPQVQVDVTQGEYAAPGVWIDLEDCWSVSR